MKAGVDGLVHGRDLGEASTLTDVEKETLVKTTVEVVENRIPVVF